MARRKASASALRRCRRPDLPARPVAQAAAPALRQASAGTTQKRRRGWTRADVAQADDTLGTAMNPEPGWALANRDLHRVGIKPDPLFCGAALPGVRRNESPAVAQGRTARAGTGRVRFSAGAPDQNQRSRT